MAYLGLSPEYPETFVSLDPREREISCGDYCNQGAAMIYLPRPEGCTCPGEVFVDNKKIGFPVEKSIQLTPQQIEAQVKQAPQAGGGLALAAIAALLLLG
jgi:hypothetical protein